MPILVSSGGGGSSGRKSGSGFMLQQVKLPRSHLQAEASSFQLVERFVYPNYTARSAYTHLIYGDDVYIQETYNWYPYNRITKTFGSSLFLRKFVSFNQYITTRIIPIIIDKKVYFMGSDSGDPFGVLDLETKTITELNKPEMAIPSGWYASGGIQNRIYPVLRYDRKFHKIYACVPCYKSAGSSDFYSMSLMVYDVATNTWTHLYSNSSFASSNTTAFLGRGGLIDFSDTEVKFVCNCARDKPWSFTLTRSATPSGGIENENETVYPHLASTKNDYSITTIVQTDDKVFGLTGNKLYQFDLFTGEVSDDNLLGAVPPITGNGADTKWTASCTNGVNYYDGKLWFYSGDALYSINFDQVIKPNGPLVWKILKGQKYNALSPITIKKADGSVYTISTEQQEADTDIEIKVGEYDNATTDAYILIES